jgi:hypothetical protein
MQDYSSIIESHSRTVSIKNVRSLRPQTPVSSHRSFQVNPSARYLPTFSILYLNHRIPVYDWCSSVDHFFSRARPKIVFQENPLLCLRNF